MAGLLGTFFGNSDQTAALGLLGAGLMAGSPAQGFGQANQFLAGMPERRMKASLLDMQLKGAQQQMADEQRRRDFLSNLPGPQPGPNGAIPPGMDIMRQAVAAGVIKPESYLGMLMPKQIEFSKINPGDFTPESLREATASGDYTKLVPVRKMEIGPGGQAYDPYKIPSGSVLNDPNKPFMIGQGGALVPNTPYQQYETGKARAGASVNNISVNTEKSLLNTIAGGLGKNITTAQDAARSALGTIQTVNRLNDALDTGQVVAGPGSTFRQYGLQLGNMLGIAGKDGQEKLLNTRQAIQSLAQLELDAAQQMKGQGQITEAERAIIRRAASGDIDSMTSQELRLLGGVLDRTARSKIRNYNAQVAPLASNPSAAPLAPFLNVQEPPARQPEQRVRRFNPATGKIE